MNAPAGFVDLGGLALQSGQAERIDLTVALAPITLGGQVYATAEGTGEARLDVSRTTTGYALRLRITTELSGPCVRCLEAARIPIEVDAREIDQPNTRDEELLSPYVAEEKVDVARWANDALVLALPAQPLCRPDCAGLCAVCGQSLNDADPSEHRHTEGGDPRMAKLRELKLD